MSNAEECCTLNDSGDNYQGECDHCSLEQGPVLVSFLKWGKGSQDYNVSSPLRIEILLANSLSFRFKPLYVPANFHQICQSNLFAQPTQVRTYIRPCPKALTSSSAAVYHKPRTRSVPEPTACSPHITPY